MQTFIVKKEDTIVGLIKPCSAKCHQIFTPPQFWVLLQSSEPPEERKIAFKDIWYPPAQVNAALLLLKVQF